MGRKTPLNFMKMDNITKKVETIQVEITTGEVCVFINPPPVQVIGKYSEEEKLRRYKCTDIILECGPIS